MISFPNCKINLGLQILDRRNDGYHDLETIFYPIPFTDALEMVESEEPTTLKVTGINIPADESNLCLKAYRLMKKDHPGLPHLKMHLHKMIPSGGGLGGGSADGAFAIKMINEIGELKLSERHLLNYALHLGSDCPFFIINKPCLAKGRGEIMDPLEIKLKGKYILLINRGIHINTADAFKMLLPQKHTSSVADVIKKPIQEWKGELTNDFEKVVFKQFPALKYLKQKFYANGAVYASMTGSGSTIFGIFNEEPPASLIEDKFSKLVLIK